jgi:folate-dependent phosphoribosylglycinamide formyltransferase PurN
MKVVLLTVDTPWQRALAKRLSLLANVSIELVVVQQMKSRRTVEWVARAIYRSPRLVLDKVLRRALFSQFLDSVAMEERRSFEETPWSAPIKITEDRNSSEVVAAIAAVKPDLIAVSGGSMVKSPVFELSPPMGFLNLHTGISPYYRGGGCTLWCLANGEPQFIGATVHALDPGIDSGDIYVTRQTPIAAGDSLGTLEVNTMKLAIDIYEYVIGAIASGRDLRPAPQASVGIGRTYMARDWNVVRLMRAERYWRTSALRRWVEQGRQGAGQVGLVDVISTN